MAIKLIRFFIFINFLLVITFKASISWAQKPCYSYETCQQAIQSAQAGLWTHQVHFLDPGNYQVDLFVLKKQNASFSPLSPQNKPSKSILISSGLHGIEGFVGSWIQQKIMKSSWVKNCAFDMNLVHGLNPWGMKNFRRTDQFNIDLNRNLVVDEKTFQQKSPDYKKINHFLNPTEKVQIHYFEKPLFIFNSIQLILMSSIDSLRKSILKGQYDTPKGLYYGGASKQPLALWIDLFIEQKKKNYEQLIWIDLHTGYGEKNKLHLLANSRSLESKRNLQEVFKPGLINFGDEGSFYDTTGDLASYVESKTDQNTQIYSLVFEYGTMNSQKTLGSIESLRRMVRENQFFHYGSSDEDSTLKTKNDFLNMFAPEDPEFYEMIWKQSEPILKSICQINAE